MFLVEMLIFIMRDGHSRLILSKIQTGTARNLFHLLWQTGTGGFVTVSKLRKIRPVPHNLFHLLWRPVLTVFSRYLSKNSRCR